MKKSQQGRFFPEAETEKIVTDRAHTKEIPKKPKPNKALNPTQKKKKKKNSTALQILNLKTPKTVLKKKKKHYQKTKGSCWTKNQLPKPKMQKRKTVKKKESLLF